jgi:hypothetical protein
MLSKKEGRAMIIVKEAGFAAAAVFALLLISDALFGKQESRFDEMFYESSYYAPQSLSFRYARNATPAQRIDDIFAQFFPAEAKRSRRYSSLTTIVR